MKKTRILKAFLLMITFTLFHTVPAFAAGSALGNIDEFSSTQICGWAYDSGSPLTSPEILVKVTNAATGETVQEVKTTPSFQHSGLAANVGETVNTGFQASVDLSENADGTYSAAIYKDGQKISSDVYYTKGSAADGLNARPLGSFRLTAYCPCRSCSAGWGRRTSSGAVAVAGHTVAVDPRVIPIGSKLLINGAVYTAEDVGGGVKGRHIDIFFDSHAQARQFGSQAAEIYLLN